MSTRMNFLHSQIMSASVVALQTLGVSMAQAQEATPPAVAAPAAAEGTAVVVTGIRNSLRSAMNIKKNATEIVDSLVAEDIGNVHA